MAFCPNCGSKLPDGSRFCAGCGAPVTQAAPEQPQQQFYTAPTNVNSEPKNGGAAPTTTPTPTSKEPKKSGKGKYIAIFAGIAAVIAAVVLVFVLTGKDKGSKKSNNNLSGGDVMEEIADLSMEIDGETIKMDSYVDSKEVSALAKSLSHGTVSIRADLSKWDGLGIDGTVEGILYSDPDAGRAALQATANMMGISLDAMLYVDGTTVALECGDLFRGAYGLDLATMADDLQDSYLAQMAGLDTDTLREISAQSGYAMDAVEEISAASQKIVSLAQEYMDFISEAAQSAGILSKQDTTLDGVSVTQIDLTLDQNAVADMMEKVLRKALKDDDLLSALEPFFSMEGIDLEEELRYVDDEDIDELVEEMRSGEGKLDLEIYITKSTGSLMAVNAYVYDEGEPSGKFELYLGESFSKTSHIDMYYSEYYGESIYTSGVSYEVITNTNTEYEARLSTVDDGYKEEIFSFTWDKSSGSYALEFSEGAICGTLNIGTNSTEVSITSYNDYYSYYGAQSMDLHLTFESGVSCPKAPSFKNILKLDEDDFMDLITEIQNSKLFSAIYQMAEEFD